MNKKILVIATIAFLLLALMAVFYTTGKKEAAPPGQKVLFWRNPMDPQITSPVPMKDEMGMDYVPVYEKGSGRANQVYISPEKQQLVGIKTEKVQRIRLVKRIEAAGRIAYDPDLYNAQSEFVQALVASSEELAAAARTRLLLLGMGEEEIARLARLKKADESLLLPGKSVWLYASVFEFEIPLIRAGQKITMTSASAPGKEFYGVIAAVSPVLDPATRTTQVRARIANLNGSLLPEMFVSAVIEVDLGRRLAVSRDAVLDSGNRQLVFIDRGNGYFEPAQIKAGLRTDNAIEVLSGVAAGDSVVTSGNFLIDSESRLRAVLNK